MSDSGGIPELQYRQPDGRPRTRLEMDQWLRTEVPKVHWLRIHACRTLNLQKQISWGMQEIILRHWMLDELVRRQLITGDILGVNATSFNDETELRQFAQRLAAMIQAGQAVQPQQAEGIEMQGYTPPPPPVMGAPHPQQPTTQPAAYPSGPPGPPPPPGVPMGPPGYQAPAQQAQPQYAPPPPAPAPMGPPGGYQQPSGPPMGPPGAPPAGPPPAAPAQAGPGRRGRRAEAAPAAPPPQASPVPPVSAPPQGFAPAGYAPPAAPAGFGPPPVQAAPQPIAQVPAPQPMVSAPAVQSVDLSPILQKMDQLVGMVDQLRGENAAMAKEIRILSMTATVLVRGLYNKPATVDQTSAVELLKDLGYQSPQ